MSEAPEGITFRISGIKDRVVIYGLALLIGGGAAFNIFIPNRPNHYTGAQGAAQSIRTDTLEDRIELVELEVASCQQRQYNHRETQAGVLAEIEAKTKSNEYLIKQCMRITGQ